MTMTRPDVISFMPGAATPEKRVEVLLETYKEICTSYHAIDEFRAKLLGILPIASLAAIVVVAKDLTTAGFAEGGPVERLIGFGSFFGAAFTLALFLFEIRGILRCHELIQRGKAIEEELAVSGQFFTCVRQHERGARSPEGVFNVKVAASVMYSLVFSAWLFLGLHFSFGITIIGCGLTATIAGGVLAIGTHRLLTRHIPA